ncbi:hypothetical protein DYB37_001757 [Aphanomyces astaci]|uniref:Uncharacterized protein n=1 Tax=Aphanomyces astaci TaxID=112090 RepID=A0A397C1H2_APHAT|nr:hypothetical protein DYB36_005776 [Aphanomyces astaci]RHY36114.1 hypothetical protein DYB38_004831 [Aphanomyces astaci]RHY38204.1 hypothetical protein DYB25_013252 [Aphanomyces astaci]RHY46355.1 hypothetical protein DYB34_012770 [Aphanomyces astaci]RHY92761.1 hypothetical protein DYB35_001818 [Aphanomyces astaci]
MSDAALMRTIGELLRMIGEFFASSIQDSDPGLKKAGVEAMVTLVTSSLQAGRMVKATLDLLEKRQPRSFNVIQAANGTFHFDTPKDRGKQQRSGPPPSPVPKQQASSVAKPSKATSVSKRAKMPSALPSTSLAKLLKKKPRKPPP